MITSESVKTALRVLLPATHHAHIANLAKLVAEAASGFISTDDVQAHLAAEPAVASLLQALAGRTIQAGTSTMADSLSRHAQSNITPFISRNYSNDRERG
ncbi:MAG: hypothetical protein WA746_00310 [Isosphaeraceae bacterium]